MVPRHLRVVRAAMPVAILLAMVPGIVLGPTVDQVAQATDVIPVSPTATPVDPNAPAELPPLPTQAPLQSGFTPDAVAAEQVPGPHEDAPDLSATGAVLIDPVDGVILAGVQPRVALPMASTTKIMTILLALEAVEGGSVAPELTVSVTAAATGQLPGVATLGLREGDTVSVRDVLAADLLRSGNDGAVAIAEHVAGSETAYVALMNQRSVTLGLEDTRFEDSSGLSNDAAAHHATPLDLALLGQEAMSHPDFAMWAGAVQLTVPPFGLLENRNEMLTQYPGTTGIKTGFTTLAGMCLVASAERDGRTLYAVVLGSEDRVADTSALFDHGFGDFARPTPLRTGDVGAVYRTAAGDVELSVAEDLARTVGAQAQVSTVTRLAPDVALPVALGTPMGEVALLVQGEEVASTALLADVAIEGTPDTPGAAMADALRAFARLLPRDAPVSL